MKKRLIIIIWIIGCCYVLSLAQSNKWDLQAEYDAFKKHTQQEYTSYRNKINQEYLDYIRKTWEEYSAFSPIPQPKEKPVPPQPYKEPLDENPIEITPYEEPIVVVTPKPQPIEPIEEHPIIAVDKVNLDFYGIHEGIRLPEFARLSDSIYTINQIAASWDNLCQDEIDNTLYDCLKIRDKYSLCDWAYLQMLDKLSAKVCGNENGATLLLAFLYCQCGYQMRLALDGTKLFMLYGSQHQIFDQGYFDIDGTKFYPFGEPSNSIQICAAEFEGETPLSLLITSEQPLGGALSKNRVISSKRYSDAVASSSVYTNLIDFYNSYPTSALNNNPMTRWAMYANTPLSKKTIDILYPGLRKALQNKNKVQAADILLNWVQTGFVYEYDDKIWGHDRAFFVEETLYYPYCDCEDRSILFSRLVRDLLDLDVALIYYPGHLATAVCFDQEVAGDAMIIGGRKFIVCDPTYIGAPVGAQMPDLEYDKAQAIVLNK